MERKGSQLERNSEAIRRSVALYLTRNGSSVRAPRLLSMVGELSQLGESICRDRWKTKKQNWCIALILLMMQRRERERERGFDVKLHLPHLVGVT